MATLTTPTLTVSALNGDQVPIAVFCLLAMEEELVSTANFLPFEEEKISPAVAASASGPTDAEIDNMSIDDMLATIEHDHQQIALVKTQEKEDTAYSSLSGSLLD
ncbi:hypothetical protein ACHAPO_011802 [Fusarium lateritium]